MKKDLLNIWFTVFLLLLFGTAAISALEFSRLAQFFPLYVSGAGTAFCGIYLILLIVRYKRDNCAEEERISFLKPLTYIGWIVGYIGLIYLAGMLIATTVFLFAFLLLESKMTWIRSALSVVCVLLLISAASALLGVYWPTNLLGI